ncbi:MAG: sugar transferase [Verrucomicrobia bacterium]|nr:MAG: sugar transferase [Verrucomicrobiota bacterium]
MTHSRKQSFITQAFQFADALLVWVAFLVGSGLRDVVRYLLDMGIVDESVLASMNWILYLCVPFIPLLLDRFGFYERMRQKTTRTSVQQLLRVLVVIILFIGAIAVFAKWVDARRLILGIGLIFVFVLLLLRDRMTTLWLKRRGCNAAARERVVIAGSGQEIDEFLSQLDPEITADWNIVERFDLRLRGVDELFDLLKDQAVGRVLFSAKHTEFEKVAKAVEACELQGVEAWIAASFIRAQIARPEFDMVGTKPMLVLRSTPELSWEVMFKAVFDRVAAVLVILASSPLWLLAYIGVRVTSPGAPVFFSQMRAGRYGKPFRMWKFRTMVPNAEELLEKIKAEHGNGMDGPVFKLDHDPRVFRFGAWLRSRSIDELPQLLNVVLGDMSLVGPRPLPLYEVAAFSKMAHRRRLSVKPGITCEWQAGGRNAITSFEQWVELDLHYIDHWSLWLDFIILLKTIPAVFFCKGAK